MEMPNGTPRIIGKNKRVLIILTGFLVFAVGIFIRYKLIWFESRDWIDFYGYWMNIIQENGFKALSGDFYDYAPTYMYLMWIASKFGMKSMPVMKLICIGFEMILSMAVGLITYKITNHDENKAGIAACIAWLLPTVITNSAMWGQCDACYSAFLLLAFAAFLYDKSRLGMIAYALAFIFKLQAVIWAPVIVLLWLYKKIRTRELLYIPVFYLISIIPAWIAGRPLLSLFAIYFEQTEEYAATLAMTYPNIYYILGPNDLVEWYGSAGVWFTLGVLLVYMVCIVYKMMSTRLTNEFLLLITLSSGLLIMFILPRMHERYAYPMEVLAIVYGVIYRKRLFVPLIQTTTTFITYSYYFGELQGEMPTSFVLMSVCNFIVVVVLCYDTLCYREKEYKKT